MIAEIVWTLESEYCPIDPADRDTVELVFHELAHVLQFRRNPLRFPFRHLLHHVRYGYANNPAEIEARRFAAEFAGRYFRDLRSREFTPPIPTQVALTPPELVQAHLNLDPQTMAALRKDKPIIVR